MRPMIPLPCALACWLIAAPAAAQTNADLARPVLVAESSFASTMAGRIPGRIGRR